MSEPFFYIPPLFSLSFLFLGSAMMVAPYLWLGWLIMCDKCACGDGRAARTGGLGSTGLGRWCAVIVLRTLFLLPVFSLCYGVAENMELKNFAVEALLITILTCAYLFRIVHTHQDEEIGTQVVAALKACEREAVALFTLVFAVAVLWCLIGAIVWGVVTLSGGLGAVFIIEGSVAVIGFTLLGLLWALYVHVKRGWQGAEADEASEERPVQYYPLLYPLALGLVLLLVPLLTYKAAYDPQMYEKLNPPPRLSGV